MVRREEYLVKILDSIKQKPINMILICIVLFLYIINNIYLKENTSNILNRFLICHFNDFICPLFFVSYSNLLLITVNRELKKLKWIMLFVLCSGLIWEFFAPVIKPSSVTDFIDLFFYMLGTFLYWWITKIYRLVEKRGEQK